MIIGNLLIESKLYEKKKYLHSNGNGKKKKTYANIYNVYNHGV